MPAGRHAYPPQKVPTGLGGEKSMLKQGCVWAMGLWDMVGALLVPGFQVQWDQEPMPLLIAKKEFIPACEAWDQEWKGRQVNFPSYTYFYAVSFSGGAFTIIATFSNHSQIVIRYIL